MFLNFFFGGGGGGVVLYIFFQNPHFLGESKWHLYMSNGREGREGKGGGIG